MPSWQAVVFDLDDTLFPERDFVLSGFRAVAEWSSVHLDIPAELAFAELREYYEAGIRGNTFDRWLTQHHIPAESMTSKLVRVYRDHTPMLTPFPEVVPLLTRLGKSYRLGLVSDGDLGVQQRKFKALQLAELFDAVIFSDTWGRQAWKPSHQPYLAVLSNLDANPERSVYIGDNASKDFLGARQLGMFTIQIRRPGGEYAHVEPPTAEHAADLILPSLEVALVERSLG
jgi:putative hydrolase of the HAD superfamily